jgi:hypothetical protein
MTLRAQYGCVLAGLLICLVLTTGLVGSPPPVPRPSPVGGDDIPFPTWDVPTSAPKSASGGPRVPTSMIPEGVAALLVTAIWTACRGLLSGRLGHGSLRQVLPTFSRRRSFG